MSEWSPYGLERYRTARAPARKNRWLLALLAIVLTAWLAFAMLSKESSVSVGVGGKEGSVAITGPEDPGPTKTTVAIQPGRVAALDQGIGGGAPSGATRNTVTNDRPFPIVGWAMTLGPFIVIPWLARRVLARPAGNEVNFGVYKGAMPLEMISATQRDVLYSRRAVETPLFGRSRQDYIEDD